MTEWEQLKKEYREIPVPADGPQQVMKTMAKAKQERNRVKDVIRYGAAAAAVLLVVLLVPGMLLLSGGAKEMNDGAVEMEADCAAKSTALQESVLDSEDTEMELVRGYGASWTENLEIISKEILKQMESRMQEGNEIYYMKSEACPEGFEQISVEQEYYINTDGLLVFVFEAGKVAPMEQGTVEFIIPAEVFLP